MSKLVIPTVETTTPDESTPEPNGEPELEADPTHEFAGRPVEPMPAGPPVMFDVYCTKRLPNTFDRWNKVCIRMEQSEPRSASD